MKITTLVAVILAAGLGQPPCILEALPPLPPELQYRLVGRDLVLIDVHASLIVDILREALAEDGMVGALPNESLAVTTPTAGREAHAHRKLNPRRTAKG